MPGQQRVGFVGLGNVGAPLACNLLARGFDVVGFDIRACDRFQKAGGTQAASIAEVASADVIVQSLPDVRAFAATMAQMLPVCRPGQVIVELSSYPLDVKLAWANRAREVGVTLLDCEVSGLPIQVEQRQAVLFKSGDAGAIERCEALFGAMADRHFYLGEFGMATRLKLIANAMVCVHNLMGAEAINLGARVGIAPETLVKVLGVSAAGSTTFSNKAPVMLARSFDNGKGPFRHMFGYLARAQAMADDAGAATPLLTATRALYLQAEAQRRHDQDIAAVIELVEAASGPQRPVHPTADV